MNILFIFAILAIFAAMFSVIIGILGGAYTTTIDLLTRQKLSNLIGNIFVANALIHRLNNDDEYKTKYALNNVDASFISDKQTSFIKYSDDTYMTTDGAYVNICDINKTCSKKSADGKSYSTKIMNVYGYNTPTDKTKLLPIKISKYN